MIWPVFGVRSPRSPASPTLPTRQPQLLLGPLPGPEDSCEAYRHVLGRDKVSYEVPRSHGDEERFFVEGLSFPDTGFSGLVSFHVTLLDDSNEVGVAGQTQTGRLCLGRDPSPPSQPPSTPGPL